MNILIFTPVWRRPEILKIYLEGQDRLHIEAKKRNIKLITLCIVSPDDPDKNANLKLLEKHNIEICKFSNKTLGYKKNLGLEYAKSNFQFDYLMELNSDDLVNPELFDYYQQYMIRDVSFFGLKNLYILNWYDKRCVFIRDYDEGHTYGAGRMLHKSVVMNFTDPWPEDMNENMDSESGKFFTKRGIPEVAIDTGETPYILDIKTNTNIGHWIHVSSLAEKQVDFRDISHFFGINLYDEKILQIQELEGFSKLYQEYLNMGFNQSQAYEEAERNYELYYGKRKYKSFKVFYDVQYRKSKHNHTVS